MSIRSFALAGAAIVALSVGASVAQADEQDDEVRALNLQQLEQAGSDANAVTPTAPEPAADEDGQGGPELEGPPTPDEGMTDDEPTDEPATDDEGDEPQADDPADDDQPAPQPE